MDSRRVLVVLMVLAALGIVFGIFLLQKSGREDARLRQAYDRIRALYQGEKRLDESDGIGNHFRALLSSSAGGAYLDKLTSLAQVEYDRNRKTVYCISPNLRKVWMYRVGDVRVGAVSDQIALRRLEIRGDRLAVEFAWRREVVMPLLAKRWGMTPGTRYETEFPLKGFDFESDDLIARKKPISP